MSEKLIAVDGSTEIFKKPMPNPTPETLESPLFEAIWQVIKSWDVNVPDYYNGYMGASGSHVQMILDALPKLIPESRIRELIDQLQQGVRLFNLNGSSETANEMQRTVNILEQLLK